VTAGYWNPAGLGEVAAPQLGGMYSVLSLNRQHNYVAAAYPLGTAGAIGISWTGYRAGNIAARNRFGVVTGKLGNDQNALLFSYGNQIKENFALGGNVKLFFQNLAGASASGMGFDLGAKFKLSEVLILGAGVQNLQPQVSWKIAGKGRKALPVNTRAGVNVKPLPFMNLAADYEFNDQQKGRWHAGWEVFLGDMFGLRTGSDDGAFTLGASLMRLAVGSNILEVDYGFANDALDRSASHRVAFLLKFDDSEPGIAPSSQREKKAKPSVEETDYEKILAAREKEKHSLAVEKSTSGELATAEPESEEPPERGTFEQILAEDESEETTVEFAPEAQSQSAALPKDDLPTDNVMSQDEPNEAAPEQSSAAAELAFDEKIPLLDAQTNAGESVGDETASNENVETALAPMAIAATELTFEEKIAMLDAQTNAGERAGAEPASHENVKTAPAPMTTAAMELTFEDKITLLDAQTGAGESVGAETASNENVRTAPQNRMEAAAPQSSYGNKNGLTIPAIAPGKRLGHSLAALFQAQVIEARPAYWIINLGERAGFNADMMVEIYQPTLNGDTGRAYGIAQPIDVRSLYSVIQITKRRSKHVPAAGERVILKYLYPAVDY
ncbi:MAG: hypothetical protein ACRENG_05205, partial [bacterium]